MQALNYCPKACEDLTKSAKESRPSSRAGLLYLANKLRTAQVFLLPDHGQLLDRSRPRPELPGLIFRPAFPVVALEYPAPPETARATPGYTDLTSTKRISLAWEWQDDLPSALGPKLGRAGEGVAIASIFFADALGLWTAVAGAFFLPYESEWSAAPGAASGFRAAAIKSGQIPRRVAEGPAISGGIIPLMPDAINDVDRMFGAEQVLDSLSADLMDECNAYEDLCFAIRCGNVEVEKHLAPEKLNRSRRARGKPPLKDFQVLKLASHQGGGALGYCAGGSPRAHLRRGHVRHLRHLGPNRITWVNAAMVRGRGGFVDKAYAVEARP
jgi:hypothetical protein